jgi:hypothetical protein
MPQTLPGNTINDFSHIDLLINIIYRSSKSTKKISIIMALRIRKERKPS